MICRKIAICAVSMGFCLLVAALVETNSNSNSVPAKAARINKENFDRIQIGMTLQEVEEAIGFPPCNVGHRFYAAGSGVCRTDFPIDWQSNEVQIRIIMENIEGVRRVRERRYLTFPPQ